MQPRFELRRENQIHEDERQQEREDEVLCRAPELARASGEAAAVLAARPHLRELGLNRLLDGRLRRGRQQIAEHRDLSLPREPADVRRRRRRREVGHVVERHAAEPRRGHRQAPDPFLRRSIAFLRPQMNLVLFAAFEIRRHLIAADQQPERFGGIGDLYAHVRRLGAIHVDRQLRLADVERRVGVDDAAQAADAPHQLTADFIELVEIRAVDDELHVGRLRAAAADDRGRLHRCTQILRQGREDLFARHLHERKLIARPLLDRLQLHVDVAEVSSLGGVAADRDQRVGHFRYPLPKRVRHAIGDHLGRFETGAFGRAQVDLEFRLVIERHEILVRNHEERGARQQHERREAGHQPAVAHRPREQSRIEHVDRVEDLRVLRRVLVLSVRVDLQPARRQHRRQREADQQRHHDGERHGQAEALHEASDDAAHEADRDEDGHERQRRREHGEPDLFRRVDGRLQLVVVLLLDESVDILENDDCVVDHDADREREREHRHRVEREAHVPDEAERRDDRCGDGDGRDDRRAHVHEEQQHDERGENRSDDEVLLDVVNRRLDELRGVAHDAHVVAGRQSRFQLLDAFEHGVDDLDGVRARLPAD